MIKHISPENLSAYVDSALSESERSKVDEHLPVCAPCRKQVEELSRVAAWLGQRPDYPVPPFFAARLSARLKARQERNITSDFVWIAKRLVPGFAIIIVVMLAWSSWRSSDILPSPEDYLSMADSTTAMVILAESESELTSDEVLQLAVFESSSEE